MADDLYHPLAPSIEDNLLDAVLHGEEFLLFDGAMGTQLQAHGLEAGALPELLCLSDPDAVTAIHAAYVAAGADVVTTNTFGANSLKLGDAASVDEVFSAAVGCARRSGARYVAADIGPTGALLQPMGTLEFDEAYQLFAEEARAAQKAGADLVVIETMADVLEMKAAVLAVKENTSLPVFATMTFGEDGRTFLGTTPEVAAVTLDALGVDALGVNCSLGPRDVAPLVMRMLPWTTRPVMVQANAGLPEMVDGRTVYSIGPSAYCDALEPLLDAGISIVGGCCGTSPEHIARLAQLIEGRKPAPHATSDDFRVTSAQSLVVLPAGHVACIGERINPTGKRLLKEALRSGDLDYVLSEAIAQVDAGAEILDVNAGLPEIDEASMLRRLVCELQGVVTAPLQIDSADPRALEAAVRVYPGKPIVNSTNGKQEVLDAVLPIVARYGCAVVGLTLDEDGIPATAHGRLQVARKIVQATDDLGIPRRDVLIDCLCMAASTDQEAPRQILEAIRLVKRELPGVRCVLGVSNVSFGLPCRELVNATFLSAAFAAGLDLPILNPLSQRYQDVVATWRVLTGQDAGSASYVARYGGVRLTQDRAADTGAASSASATLASSPSAQDPAEKARELVLAGRKGPMAPTVGALLESMPALQVIDEVLIPALNEVGDRFEKGTYFLPQLMASAEAAKEGFEAIRNAGGQADGEVASKGTVAIATVKGDIHDIGKNIVRMLLENYGFDVVDLGRDVDPHLVAQTVADRGIGLAGLSALMTTTVGAMAQTIDLIRELAPDCKVMVGGAVLNPEYARMVGADYYAKDAAEAARIATEVLG